LYWEYIAIVAYWKYIAIVTYWENIATVTVRTLLYKMGVNCYRN
jgi:hypothetical protein